MTQQKTIAIISAFPPGTKTLNEYGYHLAVNFAKNPHVKKVVIIADVLDEPMAELDLGEKIEVQRVWKFNSVKTMPKIVRALRRIRPDLALYNLQTASFGDKEIPSALGLMTPMISKWRGIKSGILAHNMISGIDLDDTILKGQKIRQSIVKLGASVVDWSMMNANYSTFTLNSYTDHYQAKYPKADITHIPHGTFDTEVREITPLKDRDNLIVTMGKFGTYKRLETLIEAVDRLKSSGKFEDVRLIIGGTDHPNTAGYMISVEAQNASKDYIDFHGYVAEDDVPAFFSQAKISVFDYSSTTGSSGVLHQTASYGVVPVFPAIGDFVDACEDEGLLGINYQANDAQDMARALEFVFNNPEEAAEIATNNRIAAEDMPFSEIIEFHLGKIN